MDELFTERLKLKDVMPEIAKDVAKEYKLKEDDIEFIRKNNPLKPEDIKIEDGERAAVRYVNTADVDRDNEIVVPDGLQVKDFLKSPSVLYAHNYRGLPIGKDDWLKLIKGKGWLAKTVYAEHQLAVDVYNLVKDKFLNTNSIGFIPLESVRPDSKKWDKVKDKLISEYGIKEKLIDKVSRIYTNSILLEHSDVPIPSNISALNIAVGKGFIKSDQLIKDLEIEVIDDKDEEGETVKLEVVEKPYPNEHACRIRPPGDFKPESFRRTSRESDGKEYSVIMGRLKGETTLTEQAYRYGIKVWTVSEAKKHCKDHKGIEFSPATGKVADELIEQCEENAVLNLEICDEFKHSDGENLEEEEKGVIPFKETSKAPEGEAWDAGKEVRTAEVSDLKIMCTWFDSENPDIKTAYKLPHHKAKGHAVVWRAVAAAMGALLGARGGVAVPAGDKKGIYGHLVKHYKQFDKEPPEFKDYDEAELKELFPEEDKLKEIGLFDINEIYDTIKENKELKIKVDELNKKIKELELKAGAVLNAKNKKDLKDAQNLIQSVLDSAEPAEEDSLEIEGEKDNKDDNTVLELVVDTVDDVVIDEEKDEGKIEVDEGIVDKVVEDTMSYLVGEIKQSDTKNKKGKR